MLRSFPRKRESRAKDCVPAFAGTNGWRVSLILKLDDDLDVALAMLESFGEVCERDAPRDEAREPAAIGLREGVGCHLIVAQVCVHGAKHSTVVEHHGAIE